MNADLALLMGLTVQYVRDALYPKIYRRAEAYYSDHRVLAPRRTDAMLQAYVRGTDLYTVRIEAVQGQLVSSCTCSFAQRALCKHIGALLLQWVREPESFSVAVEGTSSSPAAELGDASPSTPSRPWSALASDEAPSFMPARGGDPQSNLPDLLGQLKLEALQQIARRRGWQIDAQEKKGFATALAGLLVDRTEVARAVTLLSEDLREALRGAFVAEDGHGITASALARVVTALRGAQGPTLKPVEAAGLLLDLSGWGLVLPWQTLSNGASYLLSWEIQNKVPPLAGWCPLSSPTQAGKELSTDRREVLQLMQDVWRRISQKPLRLREPPEPLHDRRLRSTVRDWPYDADEIRGWQSKQSSPQLTSLIVPPQPPLLDDAELASMASWTDGDSEQMEFLCRLLHELELVASDGGRLVSCPEAMHRFTRTSPLVQYTSLAQTYTSMTGWSELDMLMRREPALSLRRGRYLSFPYTQLRSELVRVRQMLLRFLATAGDMGWCRLVKVEGALRTLWPSFFPAGQVAVPRWLPAALQFTWNQEDGDPGAGDSPTWQALQAAFLRVMLQGPLHWLGLASTRLEQGELASFRLHGLEDLMWNRPLVPIDAQPVEEPVVIDEASSTIAVHLRGVPAEAHTLLASIARLEEATVDRFTYRLDLRAAYDSFEQGKLLSDLLRDWEKVMPVPVPPAVDAALHDWWRRYGLLRTYRGLALLELGDELTLRELEASTSLSQHIVAKLSAQLVLVPEAAVDDLLEELTARGHTPKEMK
ncbi:MAG: helicase-associated domain-containing protein [Anaerolineales bacterium]|nr:MAG: helicase-associated domain-containing protein [Anaerolineales bacterium]